MKCSNHICTCIAKWIISCGILESMYHGAWPHVERANMWNSEPTSLGESGTHQRKDLSGISCQNVILLTSRLYLLYNTYISRMCPL